MRTGWKPPRGEVRQGAPRRGPLGRARSRRQSRPVHTHRGGSLVAMRAVHSPYWGTSRGHGAKVRGRESKEDMERTRDGRRGWQGQVVHGMETSLRIADSVLSARGGDDGFRDGCGTIWFLCGQGHSGHRAGYGLDRAENGKQGNQMRNCCSSLGTDGGSIH